MPTTVSITPCNTDNTIGLLEGIEELSRQVASLQASQTQSPASHSPPTLALQRLPRQHQRKYSVAPRNLLVSLADRGRSPKIHTTVLSASDGLPLSKRLPPNERPSPKGKTHRQSLIAANVCTTISGQLFFIDRKSKQRYLVDTGSDLCDFPSRLLPGKGAHRIHTIRSKLDQHLQLWMDFN